MTVRIHVFAISRRANAELAEAIEYIRLDDPQNARDVARAIRDKVEQLRRFPESAPVDTNAPALPGGATRRVAHASGFTIRYAFPLRRGDRDVVYIVSIQRAGRLPPDEPEDMLRLVQEIAGVYA